MGKVPKITREQLIEMLEAFLFYLKYEAYIKEAIEDHYQRKQEGLEDELQN